MATIEELTKEQDAEAEAWFYGELGEAHAPTNDRSREIVRLFHERFGECWLGKVNIYKNMPIPPVWKYDPEEMLYNFGADFVLPCYDAELERMIMERHNTPYTGTKADFPLVDAIYNRIAELGGAELHWA
jgi:hypothetical protein